MDFSLTTETLNNLDMETVAICPLCGSSECTLMFWNRDRLYYLPGEFGTLRCSGCGLVRLSPRPTVGNIGLYYPDDYGAYNNPASIDAIKAGDPFGLRNKIRMAVLSQLGYQFGDLKLWQRTLAPALKKIFYEGGTYGFGDKFPSFVADGRALEVGCGNGFFLSYLKKHGWQVNGLDLSPHAAAQAKERFGIDVFVGQAEDAPFSDKTFDFIRLSHVIEHLFDPVKSMDKILSLLKPGGHIYVEVPNAESVSSVISGKYWYGWDAPRHLFMFTPDTLKSLLTKCGFIISRLETFLWDSFAWDQNLRLEDENQVRLPLRPHTSSSDEVAIKQNVQEAKRIFSSHPNQGDLISCWGTRPCSNFDY